MSSSLKIATLVPIGEVIQGVVRGCLMLHKRSFSALVPVQRLHPVIITSNLSDPAPTFYLHYLLSFGLLPPFIILPRLYKFLHVLSSSAMAIAESSKEPGYGEENISGPGSRQMINILMLILTLSSLQLEYIFINFITGRSPTALQRQA